jgi:hypothetical protein
MNSHLTSHWLIVTYVDEASSAQADDRLQPGRRDFQPAMFAPKEALHQCHTNLLRPFI